MEFNINVKITLEETPSLINALAAFTAALQDLRPAADFEAAFAPKMHTVSGVPVAPDPVHQQLMPQAPVAPLPNR